MLAPLYPDVLHIHVACVVLSGALFFIRGTMRIGGMASANHRTIRITSYLIDTALLGAAILLAATLRQYPLVNDWLTVKIGVLVAYIVFGLIALKHSRTQPARVLAFAAALGCYGFIVSVALTKSPWGAIGVLLNI